MTFRATYRTRPYTVRGRAHRTPPVPGTAHERRLASEGAALVAGVDEVGMGAWAGPLAVGVVVLDPGRRIYKIRDSKLLDPPRRSWLAKRVMERAVSWSVGLALPQEIDEFGLTEAQGIAAHRALRRMCVAPDAYLVDGNRNFLGLSSVKTIVRGDAHSISIAAASLVAKVVRDKLMEQLSEVFVGYGLETNKGYPSPDHKWALNAYGPSPAHRRLFAPVQRLIDEGTPGRLLPVRASG